MRIWSTVFLTFLLSGPARASDNCVVYLPNFKPLEGNSAPAVSHSQMLRHWREQLKNDPSQRPMLLRQILGHAERILKDKNVSFSRFGEGEKTYLHITTYASTPLGQLSNDIYTKYSGELSFSPWDVLHDIKESALQLGRRKTARQELALYPMVRVPWSGLKDESPSRNVVIIQQLAQAAVHRDLQRKKSNLFFGSINISRGSLPNDPAPIKETDRFFYLGEVDGLRRAVLIYATQLKSQIHKSNNQKNADTELAKKALEDGLNELEAYSYRASAALKFFMDSLYMNSSELGNFANGTDYAEGVLNWHFSYLSENLTYGFNFPILGSDGLGDAKNQSLIANQLLDAYTNMDLLNNQTQIAKRQLGLVSKAPTAAQAMLIIQDIITRLATF